MFSIYFVRIGNNKRQIINLLELKPKQELDTTDNNNSK